MQQTLETLERALATLNLLEKHATRTRWYALQSSIIAAREALQRLIRDVEVGP